MNQNVAGSSPAERAPTSARRGTLLPQVCLDCPLCRNKTWVEHYPEHEWKAGEYSLVRSSSWELEEVCLGAVWRYLVGLLRWSSLRPEEVTSLIGRAGEQQPTSLTNRK